MSVSIKDITLSMEYDIIEKMKNKNSSDAANYRSLSGYTAASDGSQLFVMLKGISQNNQLNSESNAKLVEVSSSGTKISSNKTNLKHGNDCTYGNDDNYYVCTRENKDIYIYKKTDLSKTGVYKYSGSDLTKITCIAYLEKNYFLLGQGNQVVVCSSGSNRFDQISNFHLADDKNDSNHAGHAIVNEIDYLVRQGMCVRGSRLYKVYGKRNDEGQIFTNYIAEWTMSGSNPSAPSYNSCKLVNMYRFVPQKKRFLFEMESISYIGRDVYVAVKTQQDNKSSEYNARLYKISGISM